MTHFLNRVRLWSANRVWHARLRAGRTLLANGDRRWEALDRLQVPGFGTDLIRIDFPPDLSERAGWTFAHDRLLPIIDANQAEQLVCLKACLQHAGDLRAWPVAPDAVRPNLPALDNPFLTPFDMAALYGVLRERRPARYVEIGSGVSTRVAAAARAAGNFPMEIVSIDPQPRVDVAAVCDVVQRRRFEAAIPQVLDVLHPGAVLFFDGSHRSFPGSDVTSFFLALLPRLPRGVMVHIHDIYLPQDYPASLLNRYWSEQYLLAAWLLGGAQRLRLLLPCARLSQTEPGHRLLAAHLPPASLPTEPHAAAGSSFWFETT